MIEELEVILKQLDSLCCEVRFTLKSMVERHHQIQSKYTNNEDMHK